MLSIDKLIYVIKIKTRKNEDKFVFYAIYAHVKFGLSKNHQIINKESTSFKI